MARLKDTLRPVESILFRLFRRGGFVIMIGLAAVVMALATGFVIRTGGEQWQVVVLVVMGVTLAALPVAFFAAGVRILLEPGETVRLRTDVSVSGVLRLLIVLVVCLIGAGVVGLMVRGYLLEAGGGLATTAIELMGLRIPAADLVFVGASLSAFLSIYFVWNGLLEPKMPVLFLTDRRVLRFIPGFWSGRIEVLALSDVAEIRGSPLGITLIATSRDAMRRLRRDGSAEPAGIDRLDLPLSRFRFPGGSGSQYDRVVRLLGREPLRWYAPDLPRDVQRLVSLEAKFPVIVPVLAAIPMLALWTTVIFLEAVQGVSSGVIVPAAIVSMFIPLRLVTAGCYLLLCRVARNLTPEKTALFLRATAHPDWGPRRCGASDIANRRAAVKRRERFFSWLVGRPVRCGDAPGPEAYGGGWRA